MNTKQIRLATTASTRVNTNTATTNSSDNIQTKKHETFAQAVPSRKKRVSIFRHCFVSLVRSD
jgi:hypothetical protein